jgi:multisubunit Na+/H+ antiporter MnhC subunit
MLEMFNQTPFIHTVITLGSFAIFAIGLVGALSKKNLFKIFLSLSIVESSLFLFFIGSHYETGMLAPIAADGIKVFDEHMVDPVPQAMILTTIVIGIAVLALALSYVVRYHRLSGHTHIDKMHELGEAS